MGKVYIIGVGQTRFFRHRADAEPDLARKAVEIALLDAGLTWRDLQEVIWAPSGDAGPSTARAMLPRTEASLTLVPGSGGSGVRGSMSLHQAYGRILAGEAEVAAAVASGKLSDSGAPDGPGPGRLDRMFLEAEGARWHIERYGTTVDHLAKIASKNRLHGSMNPRAYRREPISIEEVLRERETASPLTRSMCATPSDGAAAVIVCSERIVWKLGRPSPVRVLASGAGGVKGSGDPGDDLVARLCRRAYDDAGLGPADVDIAELDDRSAYSELRLTEIVGLCDDGMGGPFAWSGSTSLGGKVPVNTSGGMEARGDGGSASGLAQVHEIITQLRGNATERQAEGARIGLALSCTSISGRAGADAGVQIFQRA